MRVFYLVRLIFILFADSCNVHHSPPEGALHCNPLLNESSRCQRLDTTSHDCKEIRPSKHWQWILIILKLYHLTNYNSAFWSLSFSTSSKAHKTTHSKCYPASVELSYHRWTPAFPKPMPANTLARCMLDRASRSSGSRTALQSVSQPISQSVFLTIRLLLMMWMNVAFV